MVFRFITRQEQNSVRVLFQLAGFFQIGGAGGCVCSIAVQLGQCYHEDAGRLCQFVQGNGNAGDLLIPTLSLAVCQQLQIVDKNDLRFHPLGLRLYPPNTFTRCRTDKQRQFVQVCKAVKLGLWYPFFPHIGQRGRQTVRDDAGGKSVRAGF